MESLNLWRFLAGLGLFMFGMARMETALAQLAGKRFKLYLRHFTRNRIMAIFNGTIVAAFFQSSSLVVLLVIAFAGAGILSLPNALGIILGANLGTTLTGWVVSTLGFKFSLDAFVVPLLALGTLGLALFRKNGPLHHAFTFIFSFALIFYGLNMIKEAMGALAAQTPLAYLEELGLWSFFLFGFLATALIQSSSAMMTICLAALHANVIGLVPAALIVVGADLGTTTTGLIASTHGSAIKKRVALAHFLFNLFTGLLALLFLYPILNVITTKLPFQDPLYSLVAFHSGFNLIGVFLFTPFLGTFEKVLQNFFTKENGFFCKHLHKVDTEVPEAALVALENEAKDLLMDSFTLNQSIFGFSRKTRHLGISHFLLGVESEMHRYEILKKKEGEILEYCLRIQSETLDAQESAKLSALTESCRKSIQSVKAGIDIQHNFEEFRESVVDIVESTLARIEQSYKELLDSVGKNLESPISPKEPANFFSGLSEKNDFIYHEIKAWLYKSTADINAADQEVATFLNVNREIYLSNRYFLEALELMRTGRSNPPLPLASSLRDAPLRSQTP